MSVVAITYVVRDTTSVEVAITRGTPGVVKTPAHKKDKTEGKAVESGKCRKQAHTADLHTL